MQIKSSPLKDALVVELVLVAGHLVEAVRGSKKPELLPRTIPATQISK